MFNLFDMLILVCLMAITGVGFFHGVTRVTSALLAFYFGAVFAAAFYEDLADFVRVYIDSMNDSTGDLVFFMLLFLVFSATFTVIVSRWLGDLRLPRRIAVMDNIGGAALGIVVSGLTLTLAAMLLSIMVQALNQVAFAGQGPLVQAMQGSIHRSTLVPIFLNMAPFFTRLLEPWFPGGLPPILRGM